MEGNILIANDERAFTNMLTELLRTHFPQFNIYCAYDGKEAISLFDQYNFNLIITDDKMPRMDGLDLVRYINKKNQYQKIMVIPGLISIEEIKEFIKLGVSYVMKVPFKIDHVLQKISLCLVDDFSVNG